MTEPVTEILISRRRGLDLIAAIEEKMLPGKPIDHYVIAYSFLKDELERTLAEREPLLAFLREVVAEADEHEIVGTAVNCSCPGPKGHYARCDTCDCCAARCPAHAMADRAREALQAGGIE